jgi:hypothetical protein
LGKPEKLLSISNINRVQKFYKRLLKDLIVQGLLRLKEPAFQLRCRKADRWFVESILEEAFTPPKNSAPTYPSVPQVSLGKTPVHFGKELDIDFVSHFQN